MRAKQLCGHLTSERYWWAMLPLALVSYLLLATAHLDLPGLNYDEALDAVPAMQVVLQKPLDAYAKLPIGTREWPLMVMPYVGCTSTYWLLLPFALFGPTLEVLRISMIGLGGLTLVLAWALLRRLFDDHVAGLAVLFLAVSPSYVFWTRMGAYISLPLTPLALGTVWSLWKWHQEQRGVHLVLAAFCAGVGITTKILFLWLIMALALAWFLFAPTKSLPRFTWQSAGAAVLAALVGAAPLIAFNVLSGGETLGLLLRNLYETELYGVRNVDLLGNLRIVFAIDFPQFLSGGWFGNIFDTQARDAWALPAFGTALLTIGVLAWRKQPPFPRRVGMVITLIIAITAQSAVTISSLGANHLTILWPWPQVVIAIALLALGDLCARLGRKAYGVVCLLALTGGLLYSGIKTTLAFHSALARTGGRGHFSDAIYALTQDLEKENIPVVALDWGFKRNIQFLTQNRIIPEDGFTYSQQPDDSYRRWAEWRMAQGPALYIAHTSPFTAFGGHLARLEEAAYRTGHDLVLWREYNHRDGIPVYGVYRVVKRPPLSSLPEGTTPREAQFGDVSLLGHDLLPSKWQAGSQVRFHLYWQASRPLEENLKVFVHLAAPDETIIAQHDGIPVLWAYPTTSWQPGEIVMDRIVLDLPADAPPGEYRLWVGLYRESDGQRLPAFERGLHLPDDRLLLAEIRIACKALNPPSE